MLWAQKKEKSGRAAVVTGVTLLVARQMRYVALSCVYIYITLYPHIYININMYKLYICIEAMDWPYARAHVQSATH